MAVVRTVTIQKFLGLSGDTKPTDVPAGSLFDETDTKLGFIYDGASWVEDKRTVVAQAGALDVKAFSTEELLDEVLVQMKIQNAHLAIVTGEQLSETDISGV